MKNTGLIHQHRDSILARSIFVAFMASTLVSGQVFAQTSEKTSASASEPEEQIDTGVSKTDVPTTKQLINRSALEQTLASDGSEAVKDVAGVSSSTSQGAANPATSIRGLQLNLYSNYRLNGGLPTTGIVSVPMENKEAVEVLKGANALQFGLANPAGIINYVTKRAKDKDISSVSLNGNSFGQYGTAVDLGRKFGVDREFGIRINAAAQHLETGVDGANGHGEFFSMAGDWKVSKDLAIKFDYEKISKDVIEQAQIRVGSRVNGVIAVPLPPDPTVLLSGPWAYYRPRTENIDLKAEYKISPQWKMLAEYGESNSVRLERKTDQIYFTDAASVLSGLGKDSINLVKDQQYHNKFYRAEFYGKLRAGDLDHDLTMGYSSSERAQNIPNTVTATQQAINIYAPVIRTVTPVAPSTIQPATSYYPTVSSDAGAYVYDSIKMTDKSKLTVGVRSTKYFYSAIDQKTNYYTEKNYNITSPAVGLSYDFAPRSTVYASVMSSFEDGGAAPYGTTNQYQILEPTAAKQREVGLKTSYWTGVRSSVTYFNIERANNVTVTNANKTTTFIRDGNVDYEGVETTHSVSIDKNWGVDVAGQWLKAIQNPDLNIALSGKRPPGIPSLSGNVRLVHTSTDVPGLKLNIGANHMSSKFVDNYESASINAFTVYSLGGSYATSLQGRKTLFTTQVDNLSNLRYWSGVNGTTYAVGLPRSLKFNVKMDI